MKQKFTDLIDVKSIVTICMTILFSVLALMNRINSEQVQTIFLMIIAFYFGTQHQKTTDNQNKFE